jgi:hypothetical protein
MSRYTELTFCVQNSGIKGLPKALPDKAIFMNAASYSRGPCMTYDLNCRIQVQFPHRVYAVIHMPLCEAHIAYIP